MSIVIQFLPSYYACTRVHVVGGLVSSDSSAKFSVGRYALIAKVPVVRARGIRDLLFDLDLLTIARGVVLYF